MNNSRINAWVLWGVATRRMPGESEMGDRAVAVTTHDGVLVGVVDGLGHGPHAARAAATAAAIIEQRCDEPVDALMQRCHDALQQTRGAVMSLASIAARDGRMTWVGVGNVEAVVVRPSSDPIPRTKMLVTQPGIVGHRMPKPRPASVHLHPEDTIVLATDGVDNRFVIGLRPVGSPDRIAERILAAHAKEHDDACVLVVRYLGSEP